MPFSLHQHLLDTRLVGWHVGLPRSTPVPRASTRSTLPPSAPSDAPLLFIGRRSAPVATLLRSRSFDPILPRSPPSILRRTCALSRRRSAPSPSRTPELPLTFPLRHAVHRGFLACHVRTDACDAHLLVERASKRDGDCHGR